MKMNMSLEAAPSNCFYLVPVSHSSNGSELMARQTKVKSKANLGAIQPSEPSHVGCQQNSERDVHVFRICTLGKLPSSQIIHSRCYQVSLLCSKGSSQAKRFQNVLCPSETENPKTHRYGTRQNPGNSCPLCRSACRSCVQKTLAKPSI